MGFQDENRMHQCASGFVFITGGTFNVRSFKCSGGRSRQFYESALAPLGYRLIKDFNHALSFGVLEGYGKSSDLGGEFWIYQGLC
ncbi:hypothetical protein [Symbiopectobacterium sp. RP]|uniref:hypothetical protein n=1 Tax=Symbiopectobacterium sp. RP TaxID=3248553 RepID=UPI003D2E45F4